MNSLTTYYVHDQPQSCWSRILKLGMVVIGMKKSLPKIIKNQNFQREAVAMPNSLQKNFDVTESKFQNRSFWTIKHKENLTNKVIFYVHGGAYISNIIKQQWDLIEAIITETKATVIIPNYEIAPYSTYKETFLFINTLYDHILSSHKAEDLIIMGDSAGGGFTLGFAMTRRDNQQQQPSQIILLSPWLDITMQNTEIQNVDNFDKMLGIEGLQMAGKLFAGDIPTTDYRLSPIYGNFNDLSKISLFIGTHDLFIADCQKMRMMLDSNNISYNYFEYPKMFHVWMAVTNMKEAKCAIKQISELIVN